MGVVQLRENGGQVLVYQHTLIAQISYLINKPGIISISKKFLYMLYCVLLLESPCEYN